MRTADWVLLCIAGTPSIEAPKRLRLQVSNGVGGIAKRKQFHHIWQTGSDFPKIGRVVGRWSSRRVSEQSNDAAFMDNFEQLVGAGELDAYSYLG